MMRWIVKTSIQARYIVLAIAAVIMVAGIIQLRDLPVDVLPEFEPPFVEIQTEAIGLSAEEVESFITHPLEADFLNGVAWLQSIHSESTPGLSSIVLTFEPGTDFIRARQMVQERLVQAQALPRVSKPPTMLQPLSATSRVMMVGLSSEELSLIDMSVLARWNIRPRLMGVPGVANVVIWGQRDWQIQVQVDPERLNANGVSLQQVIETAGNALWVSPLSFLNASTPGTGGFIDTPNQRLGIMHILPVTSAEEMAQVPVADSDGLRLSDVASVIESHQPLIGDAVLSNGPGLLLIIEKFRGANSEEVTGGVLEALEALQPGLSGMQVDTSIYRQQTFIDLAVQNLSKALLIGVALVIVVLLLFLWSWRAALISLVAIMLSLLAAGLVLYFRGATFNVMVLTGLVIAIGVIVDDAIVDIENVVQRLRQQRNENRDVPSATVVLTALLEMRSAVIYAALIVVLAVVPALLLPGMSGAFFQPLIVSYILAVLVSVIVALIVTPALIYFLLPNSGIERRESPIARGLRSGYNSLLSALVRVPWLANGFVLITLVVGAALVVTLGCDLLPQFKETDLVIQWEAAPGTSAPAMTRIATQAIADLQPIPGVRNAVAHFGRATLSDQIVAINSGQFWVSLDPSIDRETTVAAIAQVIGSHAGLSYNITTYLNDRAGEALTGASDDGIVRVFGSDLDTLREQTEIVRQRVSEIGGVVNTQAQIQPDEPQVEIEVDVAAAEQYGLKPGDVRRAAATLISGIQVGSLFEEQKVFDLVVWGVPETRQNLTSIRELLLDTPSGELVQLQELADVRLSSVPNIIRHDAVSRYIDVNFTVVGREFSAVVVDIQNALGELQFPLEYHAQVLTGYMEQQTVVQQIVGITAVVAVTIYLLMQACYQSWRLAALSFFSLPVALVGGLLTASLAGGIISIGSLVGFLTVLGITARNGIMMVRHYQTVEQAEEAFNPAWVVRRSGERVVAIVMTALTTGLVFVPLVITGNIPGQELVYPMAVVILGGLITSTLVNLFVIPTLYLRFGPKPALAAPDTQPDLDKAALQPTAG